MTEVEQWVRDLTEDVIGGPPVEVGKFYLHPEDGKIQIISGQYWGTHGLSNHWSWKVLDTGRMNVGYAGDWPEIKDEANNDNEKE